VSQDNFYLLYLFNEFEDSFLFNLNFPLRTLSDYSQNITDWNTFT